MSLRYSEEELEETLKNPDVSVQTSQLKPHPALAKLAATIGKRKNKYHAERTPYNGITYQSKKEAEHAIDNDLRIKAGEITFWLRQVSFDLPGGVKYRADFVEFTQVANTPLYEVHVIDVKAWDKKLKKFRETRESKNKRKQVNAIYGIEVELR